MVIATKYEVLCQAAATYQQLDGVADELFRCGIDYDVVNTGGFCMAVVVAGPDDRVAVVTTWDCPDGYALVGAYTRTAWEDGGSPLELREDVALGDVAELAATMAGVVL